MGLTIASELGEEWFTPEKYKDEADAPEFKVRGLTGREQMQLQHSECFDTAAANFSGRGLYVAASLGCTDWRHVQDAEGKEIAFSPRNLDKLPMTILAQIGNAVIARTHFTEADRKN